jgi:hypothetical protein
MTLNTMDEIREALVSAKERIIELSAWCKVPAEGQTLTEIDDAIHMVDVCIVDEQS